MQKQKGIVLIALIITVIVLLILLGTSLGIVLRGDFFGKARKTANITTGKVNIQDEKIDERDKEWSNMELDICSHIWTDIEILSEATCEEAGKKTVQCEVCKVIKTIDVPALGHKFVKGKCTRCGYSKGLPTVEAGEKAEVTSEYNGAVIPAGFTVSNIQGENTIENGLVIYLIPDSQIPSVKWDGTEKAKYDQFVWIPVEEASSMFICQSKTSTTQCSIELVNDIPTCTVHNNSSNMAGKLFALTNGESYNASLTTQVYSTSVVIEPGSITTTQTVSQTQSEYNSIVKSVLKYKGFWVGRYDTTGMADNTTADGTNLKIRSGQSEGRNTVIWYNMYSQLSKYASSNNLNVTSTMMLGAAYDKILSTVNGKLDGSSNTFNVKTKASRASGSSSTLTGEQAVDKVYNIYDLEGGRFSWTTAFTSNGYLSRGRMLYRWIFSKLLQYCKTKCCLWNYTELDLICIFLIKT